MEHGRLRAMTWNVWWRFGDDWPERHAGQLAVLDELRPDVVGLQECWATTRTTQAHVLANTLGADAAFVRVGVPPEPDRPETPDQEDVAMGLGLVSRWPVERVVATPMPSEQRDLSALVATITHPLGPLRVVVGVTSWETERASETAAQVAELPRLVREGAGERRPPRLLLADLNYDESQAPLRGLDLEDAGDAAEAEADGRTLSATNRFAPAECEGQYDRRIDHVRFHPGRDGARATEAFVVRAEPGGLPPSDHYPVAADLEWPAA